MKILRFVGLLLGYWLGGSLSATAGPGPPADTAVVRFEAARVDSEPTQRLVGKRWRYQPDEPPGWASPATDDRAWQWAETSFLWGQGPSGWSGTGCFRLRFTLDSALLGRPLGLRMGQDGAMDVYLDGKFLGRYGTLGTSAATTRGERPHGRMLPFQLTDTGPHLLAIRYAKFAAWPSAYGGFAVWVGTHEQLAAARTDAIRTHDLSWVSVTGSGVLALLHLFLFFFYRPQRSNLYYGLYMAFMAFTSGAVFVRDLFTDAVAIWWGMLFFLLGNIFSMLGLLGFVYAVCRGGPPWRWLGLLAALSLGRVLVWSFYPNTSPWDGLNIFYLMITVDVLRVLGQAIWRKQPGVWMIGLGVFLTVLVYVFAASNISSLWGEHYLARNVVINVGFLALPVCTSLYLARDFAVTRRSLEAQLRQVAQLSAQTLAQETERRELIGAQNERLEATVRARTEEISEQNRTLEAQRDEITAQADRLRVMDREKTRFFTNITHEFRTPLTLMLGPAEQIAADTQEPTTRQQAQLVQRNAQRLLHLINQLLDLSRLEAGQQALQPVPGEVVGFVRGLVASFESLAQQRGIACSFEANRAELWASFDADKLEKVVENLLSNAFKFTPSTGEVAIGLQAADAPAPDAPVWVEITVRDTGRGIGPAQLPHVFDRFYQADSSPTREQEGTGIGLALAKELVELHGGTIALGSEPGRGTTAVVRLPLQAAAAAGDAPATSAGPQPLATSRAELETTAAPDDAPAPEAPLVLLVEDNADVRAFLHAALSPDYHLLEARDGEEGVTAAREHLPDLVLTDAMMPRLDGYGVCRALKQDERTSHIPVVMLTARADLPSKLQGLDHGADAYLTKPFHRDELLAQLRNLIRGRQQLQEAYRRSLTLPPPPGPPSMEQVFLAKVQHAVEQALDDETLGVEGLSRELGLSRTQLHRKLKALTGHAPGDFIRLVRLQRAHELLAAGVATVAEVAFQVGYGNPSNFSTSFSRHFGYAPSEARRRAAVAAN